MLHHLLSLDRCCTRGHRRRLCLLVLCSAQALTALLWLGIVGAGQEKAQPEQREQDERPVEKFVKKFSEPIRMGESKPVNVNNAKFVLAAQTNWKPPLLDREFPRVAPIAIQLHITNLGKGDLLFRTHRTFGVRVFTADGKALLTAAQIRSSFLKA